MKIKTIGEILRAQREEHGVTLDQLSQTSRIRKEYLEALERNNFSALPAATFVKGYIKVYSQLFHFDYEPLLALLRRDYKESAVGTLVPREFMKPVLKKRQMWTPVTFVVFGLAVVFLTLVGYVGVQWYNIQKPPVLVVMEPKDNDVVTQNITVRGKTVTDAIVSVNSQPVALEPDGTFKTELYLPKDGIHAVTVESVDRRGKKSVVQLMVHVEQK